MKILILSCNTGGGHNSAASAVKDYFKAMGDNCDIRDALAYWSEGSSNLISNGHTILYKKLPKLFGAAYRFAENHPASENDSIIYDLATLGAKKLSNYLKEVHYDAVVCTHVFSGMIATEVQKKYLKDLKIYFVATDYTCSPGVNEINADAYFIPHKLLKNEFLEFGGKKDNVIPSGIPVRKAFYNPKNAELAKKELGLPEGKKIVLLMCGSMGCGPIKELAATLDDGLPSDAHLVAICGSNQQLQKSLYKYKDFKNTTIVGFTDKMGLYMDAAYVTLTKPGGLSSTEALIKGLPIVLIDAVPGCETRNLDFLVSNGFAITANTPKELSGIVYNYIEYPEEHAKHKDFLKSEFNFNAPKIIYDYIKNDI